MSKIGWVVVLTLVVMQLAFAFELMEMSSIMKRIASIDEKTALAKNEAALLEVQNERTRHNYYKALENGPFVLDEKTVGRIIKEGAKKEAEE